MKEIYQRIEYIRHIADALDVWMKASTSKGHRGTRGSAPGDLIDDPIQNSLDDLADIEETLLDAAYRIIPAEHRSWLQSQIQNNVDFWSCTGPAISADSQPIQRNPDLTTHNFRIMKGFYNQEGKNNEMG